MPDESAYIQVATDGSGKKVANIAVTEPQDVDTSGNAQADLTRYQQVVTLADRRGDLPVDAVTLGDVYDRLGDIHLTLQLILSQFDNP